MGDEKMTIKIGDLGISRGINDSTQIMGTRIGTPYYMAPEMLIEG